MQQCLGDAAKVGDCVLIQLKDQQDMCIRYFGIDDSSVTQLRHDICRLGHMITLIDQIRRAEQETESGPACIRRICSTSLSHVSFCCADKDNTTIRLELLPRQTGLRVSVSPQPPSIHLLIANFFPAGMYHFEGHGKKICFPPVRDSPIPISLLRSNSNLTRWLDFTDRNWQPNRGSKPGSEIAHPCRKGSRMCVLRRKLPRDAQCHLRSVPKGQHLRSSAEIVDNDAADIS